ncbi:hypothetical protein I8J29_21070 [Paenibacillus sp. MWE-103]|uniref:Peptidase M56 domain-containing protein n=1 Tax=Paenibacillus artemisiicola TaxID=1172618 RepID=A0ABS3WEL0_9BACL|nr:M56 family metallopeptidase [Paenibacillus artemisiicola]MBO7746713.1 hypothetical protein [Paenibacillus artemisiicola]
MKVLESVFSLLFAASLASTVIALILLLIRGLLHKYLKPRVVHLLWFLMLIKLLLPIAPQSPISLFNVMPQSSLMEWNLGQTSRQPAPFTKTGAGSEVQSNDFDGKKHELAPNPGDVPRISAITHSSQDYSPRTANGLTWLSIGSLIWLAGLLCLGGYYLFSILLFRGRVGNSLPIEDAEVLAVLEACKRKLNIKKRIVAYETSRLGSPCLYGLWKPRIYLPEDIGTIADSIQLTHILMHELIHYKRKDLWFNSLWILSIGLHWYNPFVWLSLRKMKVDQEVACDSSVLEALGEHEARSYGMTLLMLSRLFRQFSPRINQSHFGDGKHEAKRRIMMIAKFKKDSYKLSAAAILFVLVLSSILLTNATDARKGTESAVAVQATNLGLDLYPIYNDSFRWFHSLGRALDFPKYAFKVPDYLPEGYRFENVLYYRNFTRPNDADLIDVASITFVANFGQKNEQTIEIKASKGNGNLLEHNQLRGAHFQRANETPEYRQEAVTISDVKGILFTDKRRYKQRPETGKSFYWQDGGVSYTIDYYSEHMSQDELAKMVQSFVFPQQVQHVRYDGEGNSFPLYDEEDLLAAKNVLGFKMKIPLELSGLQLSGSIMLRAGDQNTGYAFRQETDALWTTYSAPNDSSSYDINDTLLLYQSKDPLFDTSKLSLTRKLELGGVEITAYEDNNHVYFPSGTEVNFPYYLWKQDDVYYTAVFSGIDKQKYQEDSLNAIISTSGQ